MARTKGSKDLRPRKGRNLAPIATGIEEEEQSEIVEEEKEESKFDHNSDSDSSSVNSDTPTERLEEEVEQEEEVAQANVIHDNNGNGDFMFDENDEYGRLFCRIAQLPPAEIILTRKTRQAIKASMGKLSRAYLTEQTDKTLFNILTFWKLVKGKGKNCNVAKNIKELGEGKGKDMLVERLQTVKLKEQTADFRDEEEDEPDFMSDKDIIRATQLVENGMLSKAATVIEKATKGVAQLTPEVIQHMREMNPRGPENPFGNGAGAQAPFIVGNDTLTEMISDLNKQSAPGFDGWTVQRVQMCYGSEGDGDNDTLAFRNFLRVYFQSMITGNAPGSTMMTAARLTPLHKLTGGLRPICCGLLLYRIGMRFSVNVLSKPEDLLPNQFGVGSKGGVEPILEFIQQRIDGCTADQRLYCILLDFKNAFNLIDRKWMAKAIQKHAPQFTQLAKFAYQNPSPLVLSSSSAYEVISNSQGSRQGGPEAGKMFSISIRSVINELMKDVLKDSDENVWYLDNGYVITKNPLLLVELQDFFEELATESGAYLNVDKCSCHDLYEVKMGLDSIETLGTCIGNMERRKTFLEGKITIEEKCIQRLQQMPKQHALLLLRMSFSNKLRHLLR